MPDTYRHGVYFSEAPTRLVPTRRGNAAVPLVVGVAPAKAGVSHANQPVLCYSKADFLGKFGWSSDFAAYPLCEAAEVYFDIYGMSPLVAVSVLDADSHSDSVTDEAKTFPAADAGLSVTLAHGDLVAGAVTIKPAEGTNPPAFVEGTDYTLDHASGVVTRVAGGGIAAAAAVKVSYDYYTPATVTASDIAGTVSGGVRTGLELLDEVFPRFGLTPGLVLAPGWSQDSTVGLKMANKAALINGVFRAVAVVDLPDDFSDYSEASSEKSSLNYTASNMAVCWPKVTLGGKTYWMSCHLAALMAWVDWQHGDVPFVSPSNKRLSIDGASANGQEIWLDRPAANWLNSQGVITTLNWGQAGWLAWGNRTGAYPASTDVKDVFVPVRRMFDYVGNTLVLTFQQKVDFPITRRLIETIVDSANVWLNGLAAREMILGGKVAFLREENPATDVMDGIIKFHCWITPPSPARDIEFILEYDVANLETLFGQQ